MQIRLMEELTPHKRLRVQFSDMDQVWAWMDQLYGNTVGAMEDICQEFLSTTEVKGNNPQQKLISVYNLVKSLQNQLSKNGYKYKLLDTFPMEAKCFQLLPINYGEKIAMKVAEEESTTNTKMLPKQKFG